MTGKRPYEIDLSDEPNRPWSRKDYALARIGASPTDDDPQLTEDEPNQTDSPKLTPGLSRGRFRRFFQRVKRAPRQTDAS